MSEYQEIIDNEGMATGVCFVQAASELIGAAFIIQLMLELAAVGFLVTDLFRQVGKLASYVSGGPDQ